MYFDTSLVVALYHPEPITGRALELAQSNRRVISELGKVEFASALSLKVRMGHLLKASARRLMDVFLADVSDDVYDVLPVSAVHYKNAEAWIARMEHPLRTLDAVHMAIAHEEGMEIATGDKQFAQSAIAIGVTCRLLRYP